MDETGVVNVDETETGVVTTEMLYSTEDVEGFSRRELQAAQMRAEWVAAHPVGTELPCKVRRCDRACDLVFVCVCVCV